MSKHKPTLLDQFSQLRLSEELTSSFSFQRRIENIYEIKIKEEFFFVIAHAIKLNFPIHLLNVVTYILDVKESKIQDIPFDDNCSFHLKRKIIKLLVSAALIKIVKPA